MTTLKKMFGLFCHFWLKI